MITSATTKIIFMVGHPIEQVKSLSIMNVQFARAGMDVSVVPVAVDPKAIADLQRCLRGMTNVLGAIYTIPFKQTAFVDCDRVSPRAKLLQACNVVRKESDGTLSGDMTDGLGYLEGLASHNIDPEGKTAIVIGAGGVGSAIAGALARRKAGKIVIRDVDHQRRQELITRLAIAYPQTVFLPGPDDGFKPDIVANATPLGMQPDDPMPYPPDLLPASAFVTDVVTYPETTQFLQAAKQRGCQIQTGLEMAAPQAAIFASFLGVPFMQDK